MILYKYLTVEKADEWLIGENSILLSPPKYLNDLLEFRVRREPADFDERRALYEQFQREAPSPLPFEEFDRAITAKAHVDSEPEAMREMLSEVFGVVSLTSDPLNELMWAHYGLNSGIAVGYRSESVAERDGIRFSFLPIGMAMEVDYSNDMNSLKKDFTDAALRLVTKRKCWAYEDEWRILRQLNEAEIKKRGDKNYYALPACRGEIAHVVFGANADEDFIERMADWLQGSTATVQKLRIDPTSHDLVLTDIQKL